MRSKIMLSILLGAAVMLIGVCAHAAGDEKAMGKGPAAALSKLQDELGDKWTAEQQGGALVARRKTVQTPSGDLQKRVDDQIQSMQGEKDDKQMTARLQGDEVRLGGQTSNCDDIAKRAHDFTKIDGINRIRVETVCTAAR